MKKPGLFILGLIVFLLVVTGILIAIAVSRPAPPSKAILVHSGLERCVMCKQRGFNP